MGKFNIKRNRKGSRSVFLFFMFVFFGGVVAVVWLPVYSPSESLMNV